MTDDTDTQASALLLARWFRPLHQRRWLINTADKELAKTWLAETGDLTHTHLTAGAHREHEAMGLATRLPDNQTDQKPPVAEPTDIAWHWPKSKALAGALAEWISTRAGRGSRLWVVGPNRGGVRSAPGMLADRGWTVQKVGSMRRSSLFLAERSTVETRSADKWGSHWQSFTLPGRPEPVYSLPGVFSHGRLDAGTARLLPWLRASGLTGHVLDFGCGAGVISMMLEKDCPLVTGVTALDNDWLAVLSARKTARENSLSWQTLWSDGWTAAKGQYDAVVTNPPFHDGVQIQYGTTHRLMAEARRHVNPGANFLAVVNQHLPYGEWLQTYLDQPVCLERVNGYAIWRGRVKI